MGVLFLMTIVNHSDIQNGTLFKSDVCIVGSGMSAQSLAATISEFNNKQICYFCGGKGFIIFKREFSKNNAFQSFLEH